MLQNLTDEELEQDIFQLLEIEDIPADRKAVILNKIYRVLTKRITSDILDRLSEEKRNKFLTAVEEDKIAKYKLILDNNIGLDEINEMIKDKVVNLKGQLKQTVEATKPSE